MNSFARVSIEGDLYVNGDLCPTPGLSVKDKVRLAEMLNRRFTERHAAAVARLEFRLSLAEKVVEAAENVRDIARGTEAEYVLQDAIAAYRSAK